MSPVLLVLVLVIAFLILGFWLVKFLLWVALVLALVWIIGFFMRGTTGRRWYRW